MKFLHPGHSSGDGAVASGHRSSWTLIILALLSLPIMAAGNPSYSRAAEPASPLSVIDGAARTGSTASAALAPIISIRVEPIVIRAGTETCRLMIEVPTVLNLSSIVFATPPQALTVNGVPVDSITLRDDATNGDQFPGDGIFTGRGIGITNPNRIIGTVDIRATTIEFRFSDGTSQTFTQNVGVAFRYIDPSIPDAGFNRHAPDMISTLRVVSMIAPLQRDFPFQIFSQWDVAKRYYDFLPDDRDVLMMESAFSALLANGQFTTVHNEVSGIFDPNIVSPPTFDFSSDFGSSGALEGILNIWRGLTFSGGLLNHELLHRWAAHLGLGLSSPGGHWSVVERPSSGLGTYVDTIELLSGNVFRTVTLLPSDGHYNDLELYLAGLIEIDEIDWPIRVLVDPVDVGGEVCPQALAPCLINHYEADELREITMADFLNEFGPRIPGPASAKRNFRSGLIVVYDRLLTKTELAFYDVAMQEYAKRNSSILQGFPFAEATGARATISTRLRCRDLDADDFCVDVDNCPDDDNPDQTDADLDGLGDACDTCPLDPDNDADGDQVCGDIDTCPAFPNPDQDPDVCDQRVIDFRVELPGPQDRGSAVVHWRTTHEISLVGFNIVFLDPAGHRTQLNPLLLRCDSCTTGLGNDYSFPVSRHRGGQNFFIETICTDNCPSVWGPAEVVLPVP